MLYNGVMNIRFQLTLNADEHLTCRDMRSASSTVCVEMDN